MRQKYSKLLILITLFLHSCAQTNYQSSKKLENFTPDEIARIKYYQKLRLFNGKKIKTRIAPPLFPKKTKPNLKLSSEERIVFNQQVKMLCYEKRLSSKQCREIKSGAMIPCYHHIKNKDYSRLEKCIRKSKAYSKLD